MSADFRAENTKAPLVYVDCNLYESYRDVLAWCDEFLQPGSIVYLDNFNMFRAQNDNWPRKAWFQYLKQSRWNFDLFLNVGWGARSFIVQKKSEERPTLLP